MDPLAPRTWAARVQAAFAARAPKKQSHGLELARQAIIVVMGLAGTGVLLYVLFFAPMLASRPTHRSTTVAPLPGASSAPTARPPADASPRDVHVPAQAQAPLPPVPKVAPPARGTLLPPVSGNVLIPFGWAYSQTLADWRLHGGLSLGAASGEPVHAAAAGAVASVARDPLWGRVVVVDDGGGVTTEYASLGSVAVAQGQAVVAGQVLGTAGDTAAVEASLGPHLYFAVVENGQAVNPAPLLARP